MGFISSSGLVEFNSYMSVRSLLLTNWSKLYANHYCFISYPRNEMQGKPWERLSNSVFTSVQCRRLTGTNSAQRWHSHPPPTGPRRFIEYKFTWQTSTATVTQRPGFQYKCYKGYSPKTKQKIQQFNHPQMMYMQLLDNIQYKYTHIGKSRNCLLDCICVVERMCCWWSIEGP